MSLCHIEPSSVNARESAVSEERLNAMTFLNEDERDDALSGANRDVSLSARDQYFRALDWREVLSNEEREKLLQRLVRGNVERRQPCPNQWLLSLARHARERLVEAYQPLVVGLARRRVFLFKSLELLDVIQEGNIGLLHAFDTYDDMKAGEVEFGAFATTAIKRALSAAVNRYDVFIRVSWRTHDLVTRKSLVEKELRQHLGRQPLLPEIAEAMEMSEEVLDKGVQLAKRREVRSLHQLIEKHEQPEDTMAFTRLYQSAMVSEDARQHELAATFERVFAAAMPEQQRQVLELRYGFGDVPTEMRSAELVREMLGLEMGEQVRSSEKKAKERLRGLLEPVMLPDGRLSCRFYDVYTDEYCTSRDAAELLEVSLSKVNTLVQQGMLLCELRTHPRRGGGKMRFFKKADVLALKEQLAVAPVKLSSRRRESASLQQARRSALLPSIVA